MWTRTGLVCALAAVFLPGAASANDLNDLVVHEWGTFTTVAGEDGAALDWLPFVDKSDLPSFVYSNVTLGRDGLRGVRHGKGETRGTVRMETPVVYFYTKREQKVSLAVRFPGGSITEWYPQAQSVAGDGIDWGTFLVEPHDDDPLPREEAPSHYYPARETDAAIVRLCGVEENEKEKFLFYRGVGTIGLPMRITLDGGIVQVAGGAGTGQVIVFERQGARVGWTIKPLTGDGARVTRPALDRSVEGLFPELTKALVGAGLYQKEAAAMIATWKDQWFEDGLRAFYIVPRAVTDRVLPMTISPAPVNLVRVLVGRVEMITPETEAQVMAALPDQNVKSVLRAQFGRFAEPILKKILSHAKDAKVRARIEELLRG